MILPWPVQTLLPTPRISSFNLNGFSAYQGHLVSKARHLALLRIILALTATSDIINLQETRLNPYDYHILNSNFPKWKIYHNNNNSKSLGNAILVSPRLHQPLEITEHIHHKGSTHSLTFTHPDPSYPSFESCNVYFPAGATWPDKIHHLNPLLSHPKQN